MKMIHFHMMTGLGLVAAGGGQRESLSGDPWWFLTALISETFCNSHCFITWPFKKTSYQCYVKKIHQILKD